MYSLATVTSKFITSFCDRDLFAKSSLQPRESKKNYKKSTKNVRVTGSWTNPRFKKYAQSSNWIILTQGWGCKINNIWKHCLEFDWSLISLMWLEIVTNPGITPWQNQETGANCTSHAAKHRGRNGGWNQSANLHGARKQQDNSCDGFRFNQLVLHLPENSLFPAHVARAYKMGCPFCVVWIVGRKILHRCLDLPSHLQRQNLDTTYVLFC